MQISTLAWLRPPGQGEATKMAKSDHDKRREIFLELVYWVFDSFLIPLIRSNFHVTESNVHRNRLFYFRHDVWRMLTEPSLSNLRVNLFEEMATERATKLLSRRPLGYSKIRLLPKKTGVRLIANLKRKQQIVRNGTTVLGRSINSVMTPAFNVMTYEKVSEIRQTSRSGRSKKKLTVCSGSILRSLGRLCFRSATCSQNCVRLDSRWPSKDSETDDSILQRLMCSRALTRYRSGD